MIRFAAFVAVLGLGTGAFAAGLEVAPVSVDLGPTNSEIVKLRNGGSEATRYQLEMMAWGESPSGKMELTPTHDVVFFPQLLTLAPGESRNVRVGITQPPGAVERTYRLFIQELPNPKKPGGKSQVQVLTRVGIPIFVLPPSPKNQVELVPLSVRAGKVTFGLANHGNAHARPLKVVFTANDGEGNPVFQKEWSGWYVLAGGERDYTVDIPAKDCKRATSFHAEALGGGVSLSKTVQATPGACGS